MTNKEYRQAAAAAASAPEVYTFEHWNGFSYRPSYYMDSNDLKEMRREYKEITTDKKAFTLNGFGGRALIIPADNGWFILRSYYTDVCRINIDGTFEKLWDGFSVTTLKHVNIFRAFMALNTLSKRDWIELEVK